MTDPNTGQLQEINSVLPSRVKLMKNNNAPDGEYTDSEPAAGPSEANGEGAEVEGEYTDMDTSHEHPTGTSATSS